MATNMAINAYTPVSSNLYTNGISSVNQTLTSGQKINQAADNPAGQAIVSALTTQVNAQDMSTRNALNGISLVQAADSAGQSVNQALQRMNELALYAQNGTLNTQQRSLLNTEFQQNLQSINQIAESTNFNGLQILNGSTPNLNINLGDSNATLALPNLTSDGLSITGLDISNPLNASLATSGIATALEQLGNSRSQFGAQQNGLSSAIDNLSTQNLNTLANRSQINDTDFARAITEQIRQQVLNNSSIAMQAQSNQSRSNVMQLLT